MRNLIGFNKFKKIYEEADPGVLADEKTYFANVKGNFAGAETTLIGSNVIRVFNFIKRKNHERLLRGLRYELYSEYMKGLLRGIIRHRFDLPEPKTEYEATLKKDINGEKVEEEKKFIVKLNIIDKGDGKFEIFKIGSEVLTKEGNRLEDGIYLISDKYVKIIDSKIDSFEEKIDDIEEIIQEEPTETDDDTTDTTVQKDIDKDIIEYITKIKSSFDSIDKEEQQKFYNHHISKIESMKKIFEDGIDKIKEALVSAPPVIRDRLDNDLIIYQKSMGAIDDLINYIKPQEQDEIRPKTEIKPKQKTKKQVKPTGVVTEAKKEKEPDTTPSKIGDELNLLSQVDIDLEDQEWIKQFDIPENKGKITSVVLESKPELVKIQLGAEKIYEWGGGTNKKLERYWKKQIEDVKSKFTRFMSTDMVDPIKLKNSLNQSDLQKAKENPVGPVKAIDSAIEKEERNKNNILKEALKITKDGFKGQNPGAFGIVKINGNEVVYTINEISIRNKKYSTYKIIANLKSNFTEEVSKNPDKSDFKEFLDRENLPKLFTPKNKSYQLTAGVYNFAHTFIISTGSNLATGENNTSGNIVYVFAKDKSIKEINSSTLSDNFIFYYLDKFGEEKRLQPNAPKTTNEELSKVFMSVQRPFLIIDTYSSNFGLSEDDKKTTLSQLTKTPPDKGGYTLGELKG